MAFIVGVVIGLVIIAALMGVGLLLENPEGIPGHEARAAKRQERMLAREQKRDRKVFTDITDLAVSMGYPQPSDGWYGFSVEHSRGVLHLEGQRFTVMNLYDDADAATTLRYVLERLTENAKEHFDKLNRQRQLEQMINGQVIGDRTPWVED